MKFSEVIKNSVLEGFSYADISTTKIFLTLLITFAIAVYIFFVYRFITRSAFYQKSFNVSMAIIAVVTAGIILAMQSSIVISLGMVGALSIVRFRTAIKDPMDLLFLFWSIGTGIICGAGLYGIALILAVLVTIGIFILDMLPMRRMPYLLILNLSDNKCEEEVMKEINNYSKGYRIKSKNISKSGTDMIIEIQTKEENQLLDTLYKVQGIEQVSILAHDGEVKN